MIKGFIKISSTAVKHNVIAFFTVFVLMITVIVIPTTNPPH